MKHHLVPLILLFLLAGCSAPTSDPGARQTGELPSFTSSASSESSSAPTPDLSSPDPSPPTSSDPAPPTGGVVQISDCELAIAEANIPVEGVRIALMPKASFASLLEQDGGSVFVRTSGNAGVHLYTLAADGTLLARESYPTGQHPDAFYPDEPYGYLTESEAVLMGEGEPCRIPLDGLEWPKLTAPGLLIAYEDATHDTSLLFDPENQSDPTRLQLSDYGYAGWGLSDVSGVGDRWLSLQISGERYQTRTLLVDRTCPPGADAVLWQGEGWWRLCEGAGRVWLSPDIDGLSGPTIGSGKPLTFLPAEGGKPVKTELSGDRFILSPDGQLGLLVALEEDRCRLTLLDLTPADGPQVTGAFTLLWTPDDPLDPIALSNGGRSISFATGEGAFYRFTLGETHAP